MFQNWMVDFICYGRFGPPRGFGDNHCGHLVDWFPKYFAACHEFTAASVLVRIVKGDSARFQLRFRMRHLAERDLDSVSELKEFQNFNLLNLRTVMLSVLPYNLPLNFQTGPPRGCVRASINPHSASTRMAIRGTASCEHTMVQSQFFWFAK